jgi:16S rRNA (guanine(966)-N(2))-methyltransferase RsmD
MNGLRVIGGKARGKRLFSVPGDTTRPITDKVKQALFNIIGADIQGSSFLDLFAGTGSVGIEALSRGAAYGLFVDLNRLPVETIRRNLNLAGLENQADILRIDSLTLFERAPKNPFDYVYIAPPQYKELWRKALLALDLHPEWLSGDAWVIVQIHPVEYVLLTPGEDIQNLQEFDKRHYGSTQLVFYERRST